MTDTKIIKIRERKKEIFEYKLMREYSRLLCKIRIISGEKDILSHRPNYNNPEIPGIYRSILKYRASLKPMTYTDFYSKYTEEVKDLFLLTVGRTGWRSNIEIHVGMQAQFKNNDMRIKGSRRNAKIEVTLKPSYCKLRETLGVGRVGYKFIFDIEEINVNHNKLRIFKILAANIYDDSCLTTEYLSMTTEKTSHVISPNLSAALRRGQLTLRKRIKEIIQKTND